MLEALAKKVETCFVGFRGEGGGLWNYVGTHVNSHRTDPTEQAVRSQDKIAMAGRGWI